MLCDSGFKPDFESTPEKVRPFIEVDIDRWTPLVNSLELKLD